MRRALVFAPLLASLLTLTACHTVTSVIRRDWRFDKPTIAVIEFENRAGMPMGWELGSGMAEVLTTALMETDRFHMVDRQNIDAILGELMLQHSDATREEQRAALGRIRNAQYLVRGTITDFSHTARGGIGVGWGAWRIGGGGSVARVSMVVQVLDVETSEILLSEPVGGHRYAASGDIDGMYGTVAFGGTAFYRTPLGRVTRKTIERSVDDIIDVIGRQRWQPRIARVDADGTVILNGGRNRHVREGTRYDVLELGEVIVDPATGDVLGREESRVIGRVEVTSVEERFARARVLGDGSEIEVGVRLDDPARPPRGGWVD